MPIRTTLFSDAAFPWAYSAVPALRVLQWRYGQLEWRLVLIVPERKPVIFRPPAPFARREAFDRSLRE